MVRYTDRPRAAGECCTKKTCVPVICIAALPLLHVSVALVASVHVCIHVRAVSTCGTFQGTGVPLGRHQATF